MDITKVNEAWKTIHEAERELEQIVKQYLETEETIKANFVNPLWKEGIRNFEHKFLKDGLTVRLYFKYSDADGNYEYEISCEQCEIAYYRPTASNEATAQGMLDVKYDVYNIPISEGVKEAVQTIYFKKYAK